MHFLNIGLNVCGDLNKFNIVQLTDSLDLTNSVKKPTLRNSFFLAISCFLHASQSPTSLRSVHQLETLIIRA